MCEISVCTDVLNHAEVTIEFSMDARDWYKFQNSEPWRQAMELLEEYQNKYNKKLRQETED